MSTPSPEPKGRRSLDSLARVFRDFARNECGAEPVYDALCLAAAEDPRTLALLWEAPRVQQKPNLLLAAVHDLVLRGTTHPLREYFPSAGGERAVDAAFVRCFEDFRDAYDAELRARIATRATQTNEVGRCAVLHPVLEHLAFAHDRPRIALLDVGASAGLNLGVDAYRYDYGGFSLGAPTSDDPPVIPCALRGVRAPSEAAPPLTIASRLGIDLAPVDVHDDDAVRWLRACLWPHDLERAHRFDRAVALARASTWPVHREDDALVAIERWLASLPTDVLPVVFHSWVLYYFEPDERERFGVAMEALVRAHDAVWLSAEAEGLRIGRRDPPPAGPYPASTAWNACRREGDHVRYDLLARSHPHGKWLEWLVGPEDDGARRRDVTR